MEERLFSFRLDQNPQTIDISPTIQGHARSAKIIYTDGSLIGGSTMAHLISFGDAAIYNDINFAMRKPAVFVPFKQTALEIPIKFKGDLLNPRMTVTVYEPFDEVSDIQQFHYYFITIKYKFDPI
jgi:hypothetical protein